MRLIMNTYQSNDFAEGCEYAFLEINEALARLVLDRKATFDALNHDNMLANIEHHAYDPIFVSGLPEKAEVYQDAIDEGVDFLQCDLVAADFAGLEERTECDRMVIGEDGVYWSCIPKHCSWHAETREVPYEIFQQVLA